MSKARFFRDVNSTVSLSGAQKRRVSAARKRLRAGNFITIDDLKTKLGFED